MRNTDISIQDAIKIGVLSGQYPRYVYKYVPINSYTNNIFCNCELWFSSPKSFNDPFDCQIVTNTDNTIEEIEKFLEENDLMTSLEQRKLLAKDWHARPSDWHATINSSISAIINDSGICCFAGSNSNILLWSHYTESHKGICLTLDLLADPGFFEIPIIVKYQNEYPLYNHLRENTTIFSDLFQTKAECWSYENELRVFKPKSGTYKFDKNSLVEVCFGVNTSSDKILEIMDLIKLNKMNQVKFKRATTSSSSFQLQIIDMQ